MIKIKATDHLGRLWIDPGWRIRPLDGNADNPKEDGMDKPYFKSVPEKTVTSKDEARAEIADRLNALLISLDKSVPHGIEHTMARVKARESAMWALEGIG